MYLRGDQIEGVGDNQKVEEEDSELAEEDVDDEDEVESPDGMSNWAAARWDGVASSLGDLLKIVSLLGDRNIL